MKSVFVA